jgi:hypothetical protein
MTPTARPATRISADCGHVVKTTWMTYVCPASYMLALMSIFTAFKGLPSVPLPEACHPNHG